MKLRPKEWGTFLVISLLLEQRLEMTVSRPTSLSGRFSSQMKRGDPSSFFKLRLKWVHVLSNLLTKRKELRNLRWLEFHLFVVKSNFMMLYNFVFVIRVTCSGENHLLPILDATVTL